MRSFPKLDSSEHGSLVLLRKQGFSLLLLSGPCNAFFPPVVTLDKVSNYRHGCRLRIPSPTCLGLDTAGPFRCWSRLHNDNLQATAAKSPSHQTPRAHRNRVKKLHGCHPRQFASLSQTRSALFVAILHETIPGPTENTTLDPFSSTRHHGGPLSKVPRQPNRSDQPGTSRKPVVRFGSATQRRNS
jgi:hypothetical protein